MKMGAKTISPSSWLVMNRSVNPPPSSTWRRRRVVTLPPVADAAANVLWASVANFSVWDEFFCCEPLCDPLISAVGGTGRFRRQQGKDQQGPRWICLAGGLHHVAE